MDLRVKKTRIAIRKAFWDLAMEKGMDRVTVSEVCERAMINRATFYRHYEDLDDLATRGTHDYLNELWRQAEPPPEEPAAFDTSEPPHNMLLLFGFAKEHADFFRFALGERGVPYFVTELRSFLEEVIMHRIPVVLRDRARPMLPLSLMAKTLAGELIGALIWWLERDCEPDIDTMAYYSTALAVYNIYDILGIPGPTLDEETVERLRHTSADLD